MAHEWIKTQRDYYIDDITSTRSGRFTITSRKLLDFDTSSSRNITTMVTLTVNKSVKNAQTAASPIDSGTWIIFLYSVIFLLAVIGNLLVILTLIQSRRMRTITNLFLLNLAVSDLFLGVFCMPFTLVGMLLREFIFGEVMCKLLPYLQGAFNCYEHKNLLMFNIESKST